MKDAKTLYLILEKLSPFPDTPFDVVMYSPAALWHGMKFSEHSVIWRRTDRDNEEGVMYLWGVYLPEWLAAEMRTYQGHSFSTFKEYSEFVRNNIPKLHSHKHNA